MKTVALALLCCAFAVHAEPAAPPVEFQPAVLIERPVADLGRSVAFYQDVLGLKLHMKLDALKWAEFETPIPGLLIGLGESVKPTGSVNLAVGDIDAARAALEARGVVFDGPTITIPGVVRLADFKDPDGNRLRLAGAPPRPDKAADPAPKSDAASPAERAPTAAKLDQMSFIVGAWSHTYERNGKRGSYEEHWTSPSPAGVMASVFTWEHDGKTRVHELQLLEQAGDSLELRLRHFGPNMKQWEDKPLEFKLVEIAPNKAVFEERVGAVIKTLTYELRPDATLSITLTEPDAKGEMKPFEFTFTRKQQ